MYYQVLARKFRPQTFSDVVGQVHVIKTLINSFSLNRIHHAYLLSGTRGIGKTTIARLLAKGLNCEIGITADACRKCNNCYEIEHDNFVDLFEIDAASRSKVEDTREILDNIQYAPVRGRFKVYVIDEVHMLSRYSFNALLKTLEEPPTYVKFILATTDPQKLPITILSRCLQFHLTIIDDIQIYNQLLKILKEENIIFETEAVQLLADAATGSMRDALSLTEQAISLGNGSIHFESVKKILGNTNIDQPLSLLEALIAFDSKAIMNHLDQCANYGIHWENILIEMMLLLHRIALMQYIPNKYSKYDNYEHDKLTLRIAKLASDLSPSAIQLYYQILLVGRKELPYAPNYKMGVEMTLLRALAFHPLEEQIN